MNVKRRRENCKMNVKKGCMWAALAITAIGLCIAYWPVSLIVIGCLCVIYLYALHAAWEKKMAKQEEERKRLRYEYDVSRFCESLKKLKYDVIIVDTNIFMLAVNSDKNDEVMQLLNENDEEDKAVKAMQLLKAIKRENVVVNILTSQLNEIAKMRKKSDRNNQYLARNNQYLARKALQLIERLQNDNLLHIIGDVNRTENYADPEIVRVARSMVDKMKTPLVITEDRDLRIRLGAVNALRKSIEELYSA